MTRNTANRDLSPPPTHEQVARVLLDLTVRDRDSEKAIYGRRWHGSFSANVIASACGVEGARRSGRGAVKGSWSGTMSGALRISPTLRAMARAGLVEAHYDPKNYRWLYRLAADGQALAEGGTDATLDD